MRHFDVTATKEGGFHVKGFPDAVKLILVPGDRPRKLADWALHETDLVRAEQYLNALDSTGDPVIKEALFHAAIMRYTKCFASGLREWLRKQDIYTSADAIAAFDYFDDLRNKYIAHDVNSYAQCAPGAVLNRRDASVKVELVSCTSMLSNVVNPPDVENQRLLIRHARAWIGPRFEALASEIRTELEAMSYDDLLSREAVQFRVPTAAQVKKHKRQKNAP